MTRAAWHSRRSSVPGTEFVPVRPEFRWRAGGTMPWGSLRRLVTELQLMRIRRSPPGSDRCRDRPRRRRCEDAHRFARAIPTMSAGHLRVGTPPPPRPANRQDDGPVAAGLSPSRGPTDPPLLAEFRIVATPRTLDAVLLPADRRSRSLSDATLIELPARAPRHWRPNWAQGLPRLVPCRAQSQVSFLGHGRFRRPDVRRGWPPRGSIVGRYFPMERYQYDGVAV
jgi:hypothetical protein